MDESEQELYEMVSLNLLGLTIQRHYPIDPSIYLWCFFEGLKDHFEKRRKNEKLVIKTFNDCKEANFTLSFKKSSASFDGVVSYDLILNGTGVHPRASLVSMTESHNFVYPIFKERLSENEHTNLIRETHSHILYYFREHQENMLLPASLDKYVMPEKPRLFCKALEDFPMEVYRDSLITEFSKPRKGGPSVRTLLHNKEWDFNDDYHPSKDTMEQLLWINYLYELINEKMYPFRENNIALMEKNKVLEYLEKRRENALMDGKAVREFNSF